MGASFGPASIKICTWCPWPMKIWVNRHKWAKQQAHKIGFAFTELSNRFAAAEDPAVPQRRVRPGPVPDGFVQAASVPGHRLFRVPGQV